MDGSAPSRGPHGFSTRLVLSALAMLLVGAEVVPARPAAAATDPIVYHSPNDDGVPALGIPNLPAEAEVVLHLYMAERQGETTPSTSDPCEAGEGKERCGWALELTGEGGVDLIELQPVGDVVSSIVDAPLPRLRMNGGDFEAGELGVVKLGDLEVRGNAESGWIRLVGGTALDAALAKVVVSPAVIATVPEPSGAQAGLIGAAMLVAVGRGRRRRDALRAGQGDGRRGTRQAGARPLGVLLVASVLLPLAPADALSAPCGDIDGDGVVAAADVDRLRLALADPGDQGLTPEEVARCRVTDRSPGCDLVQLGVLTRAAANPPLGPGIEAVCEGGDDDDDGVPALTDRCPENAVGEGALYAGCGPVGLMARGTTIADDVRVELDFARRLLVGYPVTSGAPPATELLERVAEGERLLDVATDLARRTGTCASVLPEVTSAERELGVAVSLIEGLVPLLEPVDPEDDWTERAGEKLQLQVARDALARARVAAAGLATAYGDACAGHARITGSGVIARSRDGSREIVTEDGSQYWVAEAALFEGDVSEGTNVSFTGYQLLGSNLLTSIVGPLDQIFADDDECVSLRFVPVQAPGADPLELHAPDGYRAPSGSYLVERGLALAVVAQDCPTPAIGVSYRRQHIELRVLYTDGDGVSRDEVIAPDLGPDDAPVRLPYDLDRDEPVQLIAATRVKSCLPTLGSGGTIQLSCDAQGTLALRSYDLAVRNDGERCLASYSQTVLDVDDQLPSDYRWTNVSEALVLAPPGATSMLFEAEGFAFCNGVPCPNPGPIFGTQPFAILNDDFVPIHKVPVDVWQSFYPLLHGVDHAAGLRWPHVDGLNGGLPFRYSCKLPEITRDVVDFCPNSPKDSYFHYPFYMPVSSGNLGSWSVAQGNLSAPGCQGSSCPSHANGYAIDMGRGICGEPILAPRAGVVIKTRVGDCWNGGSCDPVVPVCGSVCCTSSDDETGGNAIWIQHQDETFTTYSHIRPGGILVQEGDFVRRGQPIAEMGTTGNSGGVHLHWETKEPSNDVEQLTSELGLFQNRNFDGTTRTCDEPMTGETLRSNNVPWP